jgi:hypothetical protein
MGAGAPPPPPPPPIGGSGMAADGLPWDDRQRHGFVPALTETLKMLVTAPQEAFGRMRQTGDYVSPILWLAILGVVVGVLQFVVGMAFSGGSMLSMMPAEMRDQMGPMAGMMAGSVGFGTIIMTPIMAIIGGFIWAGILHLCLMALSALGESKAGFEGTFRVAAYSYVASLPSFVPIIGGLVTLVWTIFLVVVGISTVHRTTQTKALIAVLIPIVLCCVCLFAGFAAVIAGVAGMAANSQ